MKFTKSLIASGVLAAATTASAKTTMDFEGRTFFQQTTFEVDKLALGNSDVTGDQKTAQGVKTDWLYLGLTTEWSGFSTHFALASEDSQNVGIEQLYVSKAYMADKLTLNIGRQYSNMGGILRNQYTTDNTTTGIANSNLFNTFDGVVATYDFGMGTAAFMTGSAPEKLYTSVESTDENGAKVVTPLESKDSVKFLGTPFIGLVFTGDFGPANAKLSYHTRSTGEYEGTTGLDLTYTWIAFGLGYEANNVSAVFDYISNSAKDNSDGGDTGTSVDTNIKVAYTAGMYTPSLTYVMNTANGGGDNDEDVKTSIMDLGVTVQADEGMSWFLSYAAKTVTDDGDDNDDNDKDNDETTIKVGVKFLGSTEI